MKTVKKIGNVYSIILLVVMAVIALCMIIPKILGYDGYAMSEKNMEPAISEGAMVFDKEVDPADLKVGDIVTYEISEDELLTQRIAVVDVDGKKVSTMGEADETQQLSTVSFEKILGKYKFNIPVLGYILMFAQSTAGIVVICGLIIIWLALMIAPSILSKKEAK